MADREKVIRGLECHATKGFVACQDCPYYPDELIYEDDDDMEGTICEEKLAADAIALLKEQEARVMDAEEVARLTEETYQWLWIEEIQNITWNLHCLRAFVYSKHPDTGEFYILANGYRDIVKLEGDEYGKTWRAWTSRPTEEQRKVVPWDAEP